jgi:hypothetical protein
MICDRNWIQDVVLQGVDLQLASKVGSLLGTERSFVSCGLWCVSSEEVAVGGCMRRRESNPATLPLHWPKTSLILGGGLCHLWARSQNSEKRTVNFVMSICLSVRMEQLGSHWTDFYEIWHLKVFRKTVEKIQFALKSVKNKESFTWRPICIF